MPLTEFTPRASVTPCISQVCTLTSTLAEEIAAWRDAGFTTAEVWLTKLESHLESSTAAAVRRQLDDGGIKLVAAAYQGGLLAADGTARNAHFEHFKARLGLCESFAIPTLLIAADHHVPESPIDLLRVTESLAEAAQWAAGFGVRLGLEFRARDAICTTLSTALHLALHCGEPNVGVCLDAFHFYNGPSKFEDLPLLTAATLVHVQLCDVAGIPREVATDKDRILPGDGDWRLVELMHAVSAIGYHGPVSAELLNPVFWRSQPGQVASLSMKSLNRILSGVRG